MKFLIVLSLVISANAHALEPLTISEALMGYITDIYLSERIADYENPMVSHHRLANERAIALASFVKTELSRGVPFDKAMKAYSEAVHRSQAEMAKSLDFNLSKVFWPAQRQLKKRIEQALGRELIIGRETTLHSCYFFNVDPELERLVETADSRLTHDVYQALALNRKFLGSATYTEGWRAELELYQKYQKTCVAALEER